MENLKKRNEYLNKLIGFKDTKLVKVITGIRRSGKSSLLKLMVQYLKENKVLDKQIIEMNFESYDFNKMSADDIYLYVKEKIVKNKKMYLFFDELQRINKWEEAINAFMVDFDCDIYITGSNAYLLSSDYATYLSGRCVEIKMLPLSFAEFLDFHDYKIRNSSKYAYDKNDEPYSLDELFDAYLRFGGMPQLADVGLVQDKAFILLDSIYSTVIIRDILESQKIQGKQKITDAFLLRKIIYYLVDNIGSNISSSNIGNVLKNEGLLENAHKGIPSSHTVMAYIDSLIESYFFYEIKRFDIKGKEYLRTLGKYYIVDIGFRNCLLGIRDRDRGHVLENVVYLELLRRGYDIAIGKIGDKEIDFIATNTNEKIYIQVTESILNEDVRKRELEPLKKVKDNYEKIILSLDESGKNIYDGIKSLNIIDWLLNK